jgi:hypothetical protein
MYAYLNCLLAVWSVEGGMQSFVLLRGAWLPQPWLGH